MNKEDLIKEIIIGLNKEKEILSNRLSVIIGSDNKHSSARSAIRSRLDKIDIEIRDLYE